MDETPQGFWLAFYDDRSAAIAFSTEIDALRHAVEHKMMVRFVKWGEELFTGEKRA